MSERYTIGTLARLVGVNVETIRYYQRRGLMREPAKPLGGIRRYAEAHARRLRFITKPSFALDRPSCYFCRQPIDLDDQSPKGA